MNEGKEENDRLLETKLRKIIADERRSSYFSDHVKHSARRMSLATASTPQRLFSGFSLAIFHSTASSSSSGGNSVFNHSTSSRPELTSTSSGSALDDDDIVHLLEAETLKISKNLDEIYSSLERIKEKLGEGYTM